MIKILNILIVFIIFNVSSVKAEIIDKNIQVDTFEFIGQQAQSIYDDVTKGIDKGVEKVAKDLAKQTSILFSATYGVWLIWQVMRAVWNRDGKQLFDIVFIKTVILGVCVFLVNNVNVINKYIQKPILQTYEMFGGVIIGGNFETKIVELASQLSQVFYALNSGSGNILVNLGQILISIVVMFLLFLLFTQIFLTLIKNYFRIMLPFSISPILAMFFFFPTLRPIPLKAFNIALDSIIKQGFLFIVVIIMSDVYSQTLSSLGENIQIEGLVMIIILTLVYKEFITVAESMSSELIGTQNMGVAPQSSLIGGLLGAGASIYRSIIILHQ